MAEAGASVAIFGRNDEKNQHVLSELKAIGVPSIAVKIDLTHRAALEPALSRTADAHRSGASASCHQETPWQ
ncbi:MAG: hypothetical protein WCA20_33670 [Candidatus Sulfotelmatobacter sp.]